MAQSDARFGYRAKLARTDHDLSRKMGFTCPPGFLLPIFQDIATPGDTYYINHDLEFLRTRQMAAPAMVDLKVHFESFFVPAQMIYQPLENTVFSLKNLQSNFYDSTLLRNNQFPLFDYSGYVTNINTNEARSSVKHNAFRLADLLELNPWIFAQDSTNIPRFDFAPAFFPWQLLTYHTIFYYYYRLDDKQEFLPNLCNWDSSYNAAQPVYSALKDFMNIHPRPWAFDYHTSIYWSPIVSDSNVQTVMDGAYYSNLFPSLTTTPIRSDGYIQPDNNSTAGFSSLAYSSYSVNYLQRGGSTAAIRQMFANEKLAMITGRTRKTYDAQVLAHFGVEVPHDVKHDLTLIGHDTFPIHVGEVTSLSATDDASLGDLAGKGWSQGQGNRFKFTAPCHGFVMTIFSVEPEQMYYGGFNRINAITNAFDIPIPEFDRLGNQPMFRYEAGTKGSTQTVNDIIGWKERYYPFKRRKNLVSVAFEDRSRIGLYNDMVSYFIASPAYQNFDPTRGYGRPDLQNIYIINPHCMDNLMLVPYVNEWIDGTAPGETVNWNASPWLAYSTDPFIVNTFEKVTKVSWMSKDGEPVYDF